MYEITFITKEEKDPVVKSTIEGMEGKILSESSLGRKKFVYPIKKEDAGFYTTYIFELDPQKVNNLNSVLRLKGQVLRYLIISKKALVAKPVKEKAKVEKEEIKEVKKSEVIATPEKVEKPVAKKETKKPAEKAKKQTAKKNVKTPEITEVVEKPEVTAKEKVAEEPKEKKIKEEKPQQTEESVPDEKERLKALEDKLEEILKD